MEFNYSATVTRKDKSRSKGGSFFGNICARFQVAYDSKVYFVEVHAAETGEVSAVLRKLQWLKDWLSQKAPEINQLRADAPYFWIQSGRFSILKNSPQAKQIAQFGIRTIPKLNLPC